MVGPQEEWELTMSAEIKAGLHGVNSIKACKKGILHLSLKDGTKYEIKEGELNIEGVLYGEVAASILGTIEITDLTNNMQSIIEFDPDWLTKVEVLKSWIPFTKRKEQRPTDHCDINIYHIADDGESKTLVASGVGSYLENVKFEEEEYWQLSDPFTEWYIPNEAVLPSDSSERLDYRALEIRDTETAQTEKEVIEERQRHDRKIRAQVQSAREKSGDKYVPIA